MNRRDGNRTTGPGHHRTAVVLGANEVGSAVAVGLHKAGFRIVLIDDVDPGNPWRGMSFVNAWYMGSSELDGVAACFCASLRSIPSVAERRGLIAATTWSWQAVVRSLAARLLVDTRTADGGDPELSKRDVPEGVLVIGCGTGHRAGSSADIVVGTAHDVDAYVGVTAGATPSSPGPRPRLAHTGDERFVIAPCSGRFRTQASLGDAIEARETVGDVGGCRLAAPLSGILRAISARGAKVKAGEVIAEIDVRGDRTLCHGIDARGAGIARAVIAALAAYEASPPRLTSAPSSSMPCAGTGNGQCAVAPASLSTSSWFAASSAAVPE